MTIELHISLPVPTLDALEQAESFVRTVCEPAKRTSGGLVVKKRIRNYTYEFTNIPDARKARKSIMEQYSDALIAATISLDADETKMIDRVFPTEK